MSDYLSDKPFEEGTPLVEILDDGWSRQLTIEQIHEEANIMGYPVTLNFLTMYMSAKDQQIADFFNDMESVQAVEELEVIEEISSRLGH